MEVQHQQHESINEHSLHVDDAGLEQQPQASVPLEAMAVTDQDQALHCDVQEFNSDTCSDVNGPSPTICSSSSRELVVSPSRSFSFGCGSDDSAVVRSSDNHSLSSELVAQLQKLCQRQRVRSEERWFVRDVERILALLKKQIPSPSLVTQSTALMVVDPGGRALLPLSALTAASTIYARQDEDKSRTVQYHDGDLMLESSHHQRRGANRRDSALHAHHQELRASSSSATPTLTEVEVLFDCISDLFDHRNYDVRAVAFEVVCLCMSHFGERLSSTMRAKIFRRLETHPVGDYELRQNALRLLTQDGRNLEPFPVELGWLLLQLLEESDEQADLLNLIQNIFRRSPQVLDMENVQAITNIICDRCEGAWSRGDAEGCKSFLTFFHVLAAYGLERVASRSACLRAMCCMVNADGHGTWSVMKQLLSGTAGFQVLRGLVYLLENPHLSTQWVLRGAVFFVGMSCWGSQRIAKFDEIKWAPVLLALESVLQCNNGVVVFEIILALQRLIKKFGDVKPPTPSTGASGEGSGGNDGKSVHRDNDKRIVVEWDIILRMFKQLRPWLSMTDDDNPLDGSGGNILPTMSHGHDSSNSIASMSSTVSEQRLTVSIHQTRIPKELLDTLAVVEELVSQSKFAGDVDEAFNVLEEYLPHLGETSALFLLKHRAEVVHPASHADWLHTLSTTMEMFFINETMTPPVRLEALEVLQVNVWTSRNVCEDRVIEEVVIPTLSHVYDDRHTEVRRRGLDFITEVARHLESVKFDALLDILANAVTLSRYENSQQVAMSGIVSLFSSYFNHLPHNRSVRMYQFIATTVETHRNWKVREIALTCLLHICEANTDFRLQWKDNQVRTSRFLYCSRDAVRNPQTGACISVAQGLRALLTLVSTETYSRLFHMAVTGITKMLENRIILTEVDISEMTMKIVSSIDYRAFGRAAVTDELANLVDGSNSPAENQTRDFSDRKDVRLRSMTDFGLTRFATSTTRHHGDTGMLKSNIRDTATMLCKARFMTMGLNILDLIVSYSHELNTNARQQLIMCLVGVLDTQLLVADKDLFARSASTPSDVLHKAHSASELVFDSTLDPLSTSVPQSGDPELLFHESQSIHRSGSGLLLPDAKIFPPHFGFTSRVFSKFQSTASHSALFRGLSSSVKSSTDSSSNPLLEDRSQLQKFLQQLREAEVSLLRAATNSLSLLSLRMPQDVHERLDVIFRSSRMCFTTIEGDFRTDAFGAVLEMLGNIVFTLKSMGIHHLKIIIEFLLLGLEFAKSKHLSYLAFRLLCQVIFKCAPSDRSFLASIALPTLRQCAARTNSLLVEAAIDFLMCFAYSNTFPPSSSRQNGRLYEEVKEEDAVVSRSWAYKSTLLTINVTANGKAILTIRRPTCKSHWKLSMRQEYIVDRHHDAVLSIGSSDGHQVARRTGIQLNEVVDDALTTPPTHTVSNNTLTQIVDADSRQRAAGMKRDTEACVNAKRLEEPRNQNVALVSINEAVASGISEELKIELREQADEAVAAKGPLWTSHSSHGSTSAFTAEKTSLRTARINRHHKKLFNEGQGGSATFPHPSTSFPPLPAYDGIGGSPSYFCENNQAGRHGTRDRLANLHNNTSVVDETRGTLSTAVGEDASKEECTDPEEFSLDDSIGLTDGNLNNVHSTAPEEQLADGIDHIDMEADTIYDENGSSSHIDHLDAKDILHHFDPTYLMMQLFDLTVDNRPQLLANGPALTMGLSVLDRTPEYETHKIGLLYVRNSKQKTEAEILSNAGGSLRYLKFLRGLGTFTKLKDMPGYTGGLDSTNDSDGKFGLVYKDDCMQMMFHVATMMLSETPGAASENPMKKKRHIGNDFVHVIFKECDEDYNVQTFSGQFNDVHIIVQPLNDHEYRVQVCAKPGITHFGPLFGTQIISSSIISECVRLTCLNANLACQAFYQDLIGFTMNCEERLKQIKQVGMRLATVNDWKLDS